MTSGWTVVVPVKGALGSKTRLGSALPEGARGELALAFARDTIAAASAVPSVDRVVVVTDAPELAALAEDPRIAVVPQGDTGGLDAAVLRGVEVARQASTGAVAVLLGDVPSLRPAELAAALATAGSHRLAFVADAEGTGTVLLAAGPGVPLVSAFGEGSAERHRALGYVAIGAGESLRRDVDTLDALGSAVRLGVGPVTTEILRVLLAENAGSAGLGGLTPAEPPFSRGLSTP